MTVPSEVGPETAVGTEVEPPVDEQPADTLPADTLPADTDPAEEPTADEAPAPGWRERLGGAARSARPVLLVVLLALALRLLSAGQGVVTPDEVTWLRRSEAFETALRDLRLDQLNGGPQAGTTRPGVSVVWIGSAARGVGHVLIKTGLADGPLTPGDTSALSLRLSQLLMAVVASVLIGLVTLVGMPVLGRTAALVMGGLLALEPWLIGHTIILHTDGLVALCGLGALLALLRALRFGVDDDPDDLDAPLSWRMGVVAGLFAAVALLSKLNALLLFPGYALVLLYALVRRARLRDDQPWWPLLRPVVGVGAALAGALVVGFVVPYPALWIDPTAEIDRLRASVELGQTEHVQFFRGQVTPSPGWPFYPVVLLLRATPWLLVASVAGSVLAVGKGVGRRAVLCSAALALSYLVLATYAEKKFDRYALPALVLAVVPAALAVGRLWGWLVARHLPTRGRQVAVAAVALVVLAVPAAGIRPYPIAYYDPLFVGGELVERTVLVGWGEGLDAFGERIADDTDGNCDVDIMTGAYESAMAFPCGRLRPMDVTSPERLRNFEYVVLYPLYEQRGIGGPRVREILDEYATPIMRLRIGGVDYGTLYKVRKDKFD